MTSFGSRKTSTISILSFHNSTITAWPPTQMCQVPYCILPATIRVRNHWDLMIQLYEKGFEDGNKYTDSTGFTPELGAWTSCTYFLFLIPGCIWFCTNKLQIMPNQYLIVRINCGTQGNRDT